MFEEYNARSRQHRTTPQVQDNENCVTSTEMITTFKVVTEYYITVYLNMIPLRKTESLKLTVTILN